MLLQFTVKNYLSFKDEVCLNMIPEKSRLMKDHTIHDNVGRKSSALPLASIYGANASGKSNLIEALSFVKNFITHGTRMKQATGTHPFRLSVDTEKAPSRFEVVFKFNGVLYTYGFVVSTDEVLEEWLFAYYTARETRLFERVSKEGRTLVKMGNRLAPNKQEKQFLGFIAKGTRPNQLFLTEANEKNVDLLMPVMEWFKYHLRLIFPEAKYSGLEIRVHEETDFEKHLELILRYADSGIVGIHCESEDFDADKHLSFLPDEVKENLLKSLSEKDTNSLLIQSPSGILSIYKENSEDNGNGIRILKLQTEHRRDDGHIEKFDTSLESDGTRRLMHLSPILMDFEESETVYVIDELDRSMHTYLSRSLLEIFIGGTIGKNTRSQLIVTTHDTNLLDRKLLRRDEIWFMEKGPDGASHLTSLAEYRVNGLNYENGYLNGRFGAVPYLGDIRDLLS